MGNTGQPSCNPTVICVYTQCVQHIDEGQHCSCNHQIVSTLVLKLRHWFYEQAGKIGPFIHSFLEIKGRINLLTYFPWKLWCFCLAKADTACPILWVSQQLMGAYRRAGIKLEQSFTAISLWSAVIITDQPTPHFFLPGVCHLFSCVLTANLVGCLTSVVPFWAGDKMLECSGSCLRSM